MDVPAGFHDRGEQVVRGVDVVVHRVALRARVLHRVRRGALLRKVDHRVRRELLDEREQPVVVLGDVDVAERDLAASDLVPGREALVDSGDRRERLRPELGVDAASREVVHDGDVVAEARQVQRGGPAAKTVAAEDRNLH